MKHGIIIFLCDRNELPGSRILWLHTPQNVAGIILWIKESEFLNDAAAHLSPKISHRTYNNLILYVFADAK